MTTKSMYQLLEIIEEEVRSRPSAIEFEMAYQARVVVDRIKFAIRQVEQHANSRRFPHPSALESDMIAAHTSNHRTVHSRNAARERVSGARNGKLRV